MNNIEYKARKKEMILKTGANDKESLLFFANKELKTAKYLKWGSIFFILIGIPLSIIIVGFLFIIGGVGGWLVMHFMVTKKMEAFIEMVQADPELSAT